MPDTTIVLIDSVLESAAPNRTLPGTELGARFESCKVEKRRLSGGKSDGVEVVDLTVGDLKVRLLPTRGMSLWEVVVGEVRFGWKSPVRGPVHPSFVPVSEPSGLGWLDGFDELLVRCGLESNGAPEFDEQTGRLKYPLHGRIGNLPAHHVSVSTNSETKEISVQGIVEESRFHFGKLRMTSTLTVKVGESRIRIRDQIQNLSEGAGEFQMLYHTNFGLPLLDGGSQLVVAADKVVPRNDHAAKGIERWNHYAAPLPGFEEEVYFLKLRAGADGRTNALLRNAHGTSGASLLYDVQQLPCFTVWKNTTSASDGYVTGLEPGTNFPNPRSYEKEQGRVVGLAAGETKTLDLELQFHTNAEQVQAAEKAVANLSDGKTPEVFRTPQAGWCA